MFLFLLLLLTKVRETRPINLNLWWWIFHLDNHLLLFLFYFTSLLLLLFFLHSLDFLLHALYSVSVYKSSQKPQYKTILVIQSSFEKWQQQQQRNEFWISFNKFKSNVFCSMNNIEPLSSITIFDFIPNSNMDFHMQTNFQQIKHMKRILSCKFQ